MNRDEDKIQRWADRKLDEHLESLEPEEVCSECGCTTPSDEWEQDKDEDYICPCCSEVFDYSYLNKEEEYDGPTPDEITEDRQDRYEAEHDY